MAGLRILCLLLKASAGKERTKCSLLSKHVYIQESVQRQKRAQRESARGR